MLHELITDEYTALAVEYAAYVKEKKLADPYKIHTFVMTDGSAVFSSAARAFRAVKPKQGTYSTTCDEVLPENAADFPTPGKKKDSALFIAFADSLDDRYTSKENADRFLAALGTYIDRCTAYKNAQCAVCITVPMPLSLENGITKLAEREYFCYLAAHLDDPHAAFAQRVLDLCRDKCRLEGRSITLYMCDNIIGPDCSSLSFAGADPARIVDEAIRTGIVRITDEDYSSYFGCTYIRDVYSAILHGTRVVKSGHVYNISAINACAADMKLALADAFSDRFRLVCERGAVEHTSHTGLDWLKYISLYSDNKPWKPTFDLGEIMYRLACIGLDCEYAMERLLGVYNGRLPRMKTVNLEMLKEFDAICRRHGIQYFIAAGTLLGAVRHHDVIPWDDDFDIGMLREDYKKLCKVLDSELPGKYIFSHPGNESGSNYWIDKIRVRETYYTTPYFADFTNPDGVFIDIFIYDITSNKKFWQKFHIMTIQAFCLMISTKWTDGPRPGRYGKISKILHPFLKLVPMKLLHAMLNASAGKYRRRKNSKYVVDTVGLNINKGALPLECVDEVIYTDFLGAQLPIPKNYEKYLTHFYGKKHMSLPPVSSRISGHNFRRLDFGEYLYSDECTGAIPKIDVRGELYEVPVNRNN